MELTGSQIVMECLIEQGVDTVFGYPGGTILNIYDELYKYSDKIKHILTSHEQGASHAADGYARSTGKVGVCFATSGPGATNLVTGIATAYMDSIPIVAVTCNVTVPLLGKDTFQEIDISGITMPITKHNFIVKDVNKLADTIRKAFAIAKSGRPGPVLVDITKDATANSCEYTPIDPSEVVINYEKPVIKEDDLKNVANKLSKAKKPVIFVGGGINLSNASASLYDFATKYNAPACDTMMGKGAFPGNDELYTGMLGMHGTKTSNYAVTNCDLLFAVGVRFSDRVTGNVKKYAPNAEIIHVDIDPAEINKNIKTNASIVGDAKEVLDALTKIIDKQDHSEWLSELKDFAKKNPIPSPNPNRLDCPYIIETISDKTKGDAIICTEVGQHQLWTSLHYTFTKPRTLLSSGGLGTMGYGLGAAIGAKVANPDKKVINIAGDGCFRMNMIELMTAARNNLPVIEVVVDNRVLGNVRQWQTLFYGKRYSETVLDDGTDFIKIAEGMGAKAILVTTKEELDAALEEAFKVTDRPVVLDCMIDPDDKVWPMVAPGAPINENINENDY